MGKLIAIFGGENGHGKTKYELKEIDDEVFRLANKKEPVFLLLAFANRFEQNYMTVMRNIYEKYGCKMDQITRSMLQNKNLCKSKIERADIIYIGGGDSRMFMQTIRKNGMNKMLINAYNNGKILVGDCCGTVCFGKYGNSDSKKFTLNEDKLSQDEFEKKVLKRIFKIKGLNLINVLMCPHYDKEKYRPISLKKMMKKTFRIPAIAGMCGTALEIVDDKYRILRTIDNARVMKFFWKKKVYIEKNIEINKEFTNISKLLKKD